MNRAKIQTQLKTLPDKPGVYMFKDANGAVIYVGKSRSLTKRVRSYFTKKTSDPKTARLVQQIARLDYYVTQNEVEALVLECNFIKAYRPKFNVNYRDDKSYPSLAVSVDDDWPRLRYTRERPKPGHRYFGPYTNALAVRETLETLLSIFPLRTCTDSQLARAKAMGSPCLYYHIGRCAGPCVGRIDAEQYRRMVAQVVAFLEGRQEQVIADLDSQMKEASARLDFERAAVLRDRKSAAGAILERQRVVTDSRLNQDVFGLAVDENISCIQFLKVRAGKLVGTQDFILDKGDQLEQSALVGSFIEQYYLTAEVVPREVVLPVALPDRDVVSQWLKAKRGGPVKIVRPHRGWKAKLLSMAMENAVHSLERFKNRTGYEEKMIGQALEQLKEALELKGLPMAIECFDVSTIQGSQSVGALVTFSAGQPDKNGYRRFRLSSKGHPDDFSMMKELVRRRFTSVDQDRLPDLVIVDGGRPQLTAALQALSDLGLAGVPVIGLAKGEEDIYLPGRPEPLKLPAGSQALYLVQRVRDEAHRFAVTYHRLLRGKTMRRSSLEDVPGIGRQRHRQLIRHFGSVRKILQASEQDLVAAGLPAGVARQVRGWASDARSRAPAGR